MRSSFLAVAALALAACTQPNQTEPAPNPVEVNAPSGEYALDPHHTTVTVRARHLGLAYYTLRFNTVSGVLHFNAEDPAQSVIEATVAVTSLDTPFAGERDFDAELQNSEWLNSAEFPNATFRSTAVEQTGPNTARVTGDLTIKGATHPLTLDVTFAGSHAQHPFGMPVSMLGFSAHGSLLRSQFGANALMPAPGTDAGIADEVELVIEAEFTRPVEGSPAPINTPAEPVD
jgi:polyisoprenoid-binding protein YceI